MRRNSLERDLFNSALLNKLRPDERCGQKLGIEPVGWNLHPPDLRGGKTAQRGAREQRCG